MFVEIQALLGRVHQLWVIHINGPFKDVNEKTVHFYRWRVVKCCFRSATSPLNLRNSALNPAEFEYYR